MKSKTGKSDLISFAALVLIIIVGYIVIKAVIEALKAKGG